MAHAVRLMAVDDNATNLDIIQEALEDDYTLELLSSGKECLSKINANQPNLILMDVNMPEMDGYETCKKLKADPKTSNIPVLFVSALNSLDERMAGYEAGAEDFISKPFEVKELTAKIEVTLRNQEANEKNQSSATEAMNAAMAAMSSASEYGKIIQFLEKTNACCSYERLAEILIGTTNSMGLNCLVQLRSRTEHYCLDTSGSVKPLEVDLLSKLKSKDKIFTFSCRTLFNFNKISLLVKNMPVDNIDKFRQLKDSVAVLLNGVEARMDFISVDEQKLAQDRLTKKMLQHTHKSLDKLKNKFEEHKQKGAKVIRTMLEDIEVNLVSMDLVDDQAAFLLGVVDREMSKVMDLYEFGDEMETQFAEILANFNGIILD